MADGTPAAVVIQQAFLVDIDSPNRERLVFGWMPISISDEKAANWESVSIIGRSEPIMGYSDSGPRNFGFEFEFYASLFQSDQDNLGGLTGYDIVKQKVDWLRSLSYPDYTGQYLKPPHRVLLSIGALLKSIVICTSCNATYEGPWNERLLPMIAKVSIALQEVNRIPFSYEQVREGRDIGEIVPFQTQRPYSRLTEGRRVD